jgi:hypothetical protein
MPSLRTAGALYLLITGATSITIIPSTLYLPKQYQALSNPASSDLDLFLKSYPKIGYNRPKLAEFNASRLVPTSRSQPITKSSNIYPSQDSFVQGTIDAWTQNQHFMIDPEIVWFTILKQLNYYLSNHQDSGQVQNNINYQKKITFDLDLYLNLEHHTVGEFIYNVSRILDIETRGRFKAPELYSWLKPSFTTSKRYEDAIIANLLLTGPINSLSSGYNAPSSANTPLDNASPLSSSECGMPSITLLGTQSDWKQLLQNIERLTAFGTQPTNYGEGLRVIISRFVQSFDNPNDPTIRRFWDTIVSNASQDGECLRSSIVSGWVTGFYYWDASGQMLPRDRATTPFYLDREGFFSRSISDLPHTYTNTPLRYRGMAMGPVYTLLGNLTAGMVGKRVTRGAPEGYAAAMQKADFSLPPTVSQQQHSMLEPISRWLLITEPCEALAGESVISTWSRCHSPGE